MMTPTNKRNGAKVGAVREPPLPPLPKTALTPSPLSQSVRGGEAHLPISKSN